MFNVAMSLSMVLAKIGAGVPFLLNLIIDKLYDLTAKKAPTWVIAPHQKTNRQLESRDAFSLPLEPTDDSPNTEFVDPGRRWDAVTGPARRRRALDGELRQGLDVQRRLPGRDIGVAVADPGKNDRGQRQKLREI